MTDRNRRLSAVTVEKRNRESPGVQLETLLACPHCHGVLGFRDQQIRCTSCDYFRDQDIAGCVDLRPVPSDFSVDWLNRQSIMERWYRNLSSDHECAVASFHYDYSGLAPYLNGLHGRIVDIGGGLGLARAYLPAGVSYVVVEPSLDWLSSRWRFVEQAFPCLGEHLDLVLGVGEHLPLKTGVFDAALALWSLNHVGDLDLVLKETHRILAAGARLMAVLEDITPTAADLNGRPELTRLVGRDEPQADHITITEPMLAALIDGRFEVKERSWIRHYLLLELVKAA